jgi:hypothetical protein
MDLRTKVNSALASLVLLAGCGSADDERLPAGCTPSAQELVGALASAPGPVELSGLSLSGCVVKSSEPAEVQELGGAYLAAATALGRDATRNPEGQAALRLGYLVGAVRRGSELTPGFHSELVRRIEQEAVPIAGRSAAYAAGIRAGRRSG